MTPRFPATMLLAALLIAGVDVGPVSAQSADAPFPWSPLTPIADLPRDAANVVRTTPDVLGPSRRIGMFWSAGNPAAIVLEMQPRWAQLELGARDASGDYRRPLDPGAVRVHQGRGFGWQPAGEALGLAGGVAFDETRFDAGTNATTLQPYGTVPYVVTDSSASENRFLRAQLEGAAGWQIGRFAVGAAAGYESLEGHSRNARIPRRHSSATPAATVGVLTILMDGRAAIGAHLRGNRTVEISQIANNSRGEPYVTRFNGFADPQVLIIDRGSYFRRREVDARAAGLSAAATVAAWTLVGYAEIGTLDEGQFSERVAEPPTDEWQAASLEGGLAFQRALSSQLILTAETIWRQLSGDAHLTGSDSVIFRADESVLSAAVEARRQLSGPARWGYRLGLGAVFENRDRGDDIPGAVRTRIESRLLSIEAELAHRITESLALSFAAMQAHYAPRGRIPPTTLYPAAIRDVASRETAYFTRGAWRSRIGSVVDVRTSGSTNLRLGGFYQSLSARKSHTQFAEAPMGSRTSWGMTVGVTLRD